MDLSSPTQGELDRVSSGGDAPVSGFDDLEGLDGIVQVHDGLLSGPDAIHEVVHLVWERLMLHVSGIRCGCWNGDIQSSWPGKLVYAHKRLLITVPLLPKISTL
jgi:hypothetical protein